jgi:serine protease AprX
MVAARRLAHSLLILALFGGIIPLLLEPEETSIGKIQPQLAYLAVQDPGQLVNVIIQAGDLSPVRSEIKALGGMVIHDLRMIEGLAAVIPAGKTLDLVSNPAVRWISLDSPIQSSQSIDRQKKDSPAPSAREADHEIGPVSLANSFNEAVRAVELWNEAPDYIQGRGVTVAVIDSGSFRTSSIGRRLIKQENFSRDEYTLEDRYGHGTFITSLIAADGSETGGRYIGVAPRANVISLRISDDTGRSNESDVVGAMQWVYDNRLAYNIRVVNLSINSSSMQSYHISPLCAAAEVLWANGILVVASAGNSGTTGMYPPANDPFVLTVGATDDRGTPDLSDDAVASFSAYGKTELNTAKPELVAPGVGLIAYLPDHPSLAISREHPENRVSEEYFRMSGTSVAAALVSGAAALLFESSPHLTPDQAKYRLTAAANQDWPGYRPDTAGSGYLDIYAAVKITADQSANTGLLASQLLWEGNDPLLLGSVAWGSVSWGSVAWGSVAWGSDYWGD